MLAIPHRWLVVALAIVAAVGGIGWLARDSEGVSNPVAPPAQTPPPPIAATPRGDLGATGQRQRAQAPHGADRTTNPPRPVQPLPPLDAPVAGILDELEARARAGDVRAACRLASELSRCGSVRNRLAMEELRAEWLAGQDTGPSNEQVEVIARNQVALELDQQACVGVSRAQTRESLRWLLVAARGRHAESMTAFVAGGWFLDPTLIHQGEVVTAYAREAESMALALVEQGDPEMLRLLAMAYADDRRMFTGILQEAVAPDPVKARAMLALSIERTPAPRTPPTRPPAGITSSGTRVDPVQRGIERLDARLDAAQRAEADALLAKMRERVATAPPPAPPAMQSFRGFTLVQPASCDQ